MSYTLGEAAKAVGKSKSTISKALKTGKLSYEGKTSAGYKINKAELFRVYPKPQKTVEAERLETPSEHLKNAVELAELRAENKALQEQVDMLKTDKEDWKKQAQILALTDQRKAGGGLFGWFKKE
ncbi:MAG: hypothetical protein JKX99_08050 [Robiginitomaculum sp.]|nr:hypothetical protein [Robiginitomaculum sp.]